MERRQFVKTFAVASMSMGISPFTFAVDYPKDVRITRILRFDLRSRRSKVAGKNARLDVHGDTTTDAMVRIYTNTGVEAIGHCRAGEKELSTLLGKDPFQYLDLTQKQITAPIGANTMALWDLCGRLLNKPVYELLGGQGRERVPVYDGSIYFADLLPQFEANPMDRFRKEIDMALAAGHRAVKVKIGRGAKWMPRPEGDARDLEVVQTIRRHAGPDLILGVDANNGYDLTGAKRWIDKTADFNLAFVEELFPEAIEPCLELKAHIRAHDLKTLLADGETQQSLDPLRPLMDAKAIDVLQGDMNHFGVEGILTESEWSLPHGQQVAPHNWGSLIGFYAQLHVGRAIPNFYRAEHDPLTNDVLIADGYAIRDGLATVPNAPGFGLAIDEGMFAKEAKVRFDLKS